MRDQKVYATTNQVAATFIWLKPRQVWRRLGMMDAMGRGGFTLIELLVVIAIIAILAALLFPVFAGVKQSSKQSVCLSNSRQIVTADLLYLSDYDSTYPQTRQSSSNPAVDDVNGSIDEPSFGSVFNLIQPYVKAGIRLFSCPVDPDPFGKQCLLLDPDAPDLTSYLANAYFVFGLNESQVAAPANTISFSERRSETTDGADPYCDNVYRPWFNSLNPQAPEDEMDPALGAVATQRHATHSNFGFADGHAKSLAWTATYAPPQVNLHRIDGAGSN
ncbi:MAG TPA: prepilin-type N-terminal cleavage/methylation domain-containing protein [Fimbriimonas sp.]|nr:prepilin-type N-terminal cleavage/methylation domain-containing protein [Fimbriimonas sp.]